jgi:alpha-L-fucosidase
MTEELEITKVEQAIRQEAQQRAEARTDRRLDWWRQARFGMFIHWGLYAIPAGTWRGERVSGIGEWIMHRARIPVAEYELLAAQFNPIKFNAKEWVTLAKAAGQRYLVITSKHHDGFCLFKSAVSAYNVVDATPFGRDVIAELAEACAQEGIKLCFYYSQTQDWHHPDGDGNDWDYLEEEKDFAGYVENYVKPQVHELLTQYGPIGLIWFDTPKRMAVEQSQSLLNLVHTLQPDCLVSGRVGNAQGDYSSTRDNRIPPVAVDMDWETPATINDTWGYKSYDHNWKSTQDLVRKLVDIVSKGGNYLLNVGPTAEGLVPEPSVERLLAMGAWLRVNGESVYDTQPGPLQGLDWYRTTCRPGRIYLHVFAWPLDGKLRIPVMDIVVESAALLADVMHKVLPLEIVGEDLIIHGPVDAPDAMDTVVVLEVKQPLG